MRGLLADHGAADLADERALQAQQMAGAAMLTADELQRLRMMENLDLLSQVGGLEQDLAQRRLDEPFDALQFRAALLGLAPMPQQSTQRGTVTTTQSGGLLQDMLGRFAGGIGRGIMG